MLFVDGENLVNSAEVVARKASITLKEGTVYVPGSFVWLPPERDPVGGTPGRHPRLRIGSEEYLNLRVWGERAYYYTSIAGDSRKVEKLRELISNAGFDPFVVKQRRGAQATKGLDVALTTDLLSHAHRDNYDVAILIAGDGDFVPLVEEVKRLGKLVYVLASRSRGLSPALRLAADTFMDFDLGFRRLWRHALDNDLVR